MIYSGTLYWTSDERELLEVRRAEIGDRAEFLVAEASHDFSGSPREQELPTSTMVDISDIQGAGHSSYRKREARQRNALLPRMEPDDVFIFADLDEIVHGDDIEDIARAAREHGLVRLHMRMYRYWINWERQNGWARAFAASGRYFAETGHSVGKIRRSDEGRWVVTKGQHFTCLGDDRMLQTRMANRAQFMPPDKRKALQERKPFGKEQYNLVEIDDSYPHSIRDNMEYWSQHLK